MTNTHPYTIYKILSNDVWQAAAAHADVPEMPIDVSDGYMHFSTEAQLSETLQIHFNGQSGLVVLAVSTHQMGAALRWEPSRGGALFPHLYGPCPKSAVLSRRTASVDAQGVVRFSDPT